MKKIFLSYASEDRELVEPIYYELISSKYDVFFDTKSLLEGLDFNDRIRKAINDSDFLIYCISPHSISPGSYTLTELRFIEEKWPHPGKHVLPVFVRDTNFDAIPNYLKAVTILDPVGNVAAEVGASISKLGRRKWFPKSLTVIGVVILIVFFVVFFGQNFLELLRPREEVYVLTRKDLLEIAASLRSNTAQMSENERSQAETDSENIERAAAEVPDEISIPFASIPAWLTTAMNEIGQAEIRGERHNARILEYISSAGINPQSLGDELPWVSYFVNWVFEQVGIEGTNDGRARSWLKWGIALDKPRAGCVVVFYRISPDHFSGHVGFYLHETKTQIICVAGNVSNEVRIHTYPKSRLLGYRWPQRPNPSS